MSDKWYKEEDDALVWWKETDTKGEWIFSFDKKTEYNLFRDYPHELNAEQKAIFDKEHPEWKEFFKDRQ